MDALFGAAEPATGGRRYASSERPKPKTENRKPKTAYDSSAMSSLFTFRPTVLPDTPAMRSAGT